MTARPRARRRAAASGSLSITLSAVSEAPATPAPAPLRPRPERIEIIANPHAGGVGPGVEAEVLAILADLKVQARLSTPEPKDLRASLQAAVDRAPDLVVVIAGDGTARAAAELCGPNGPMVAPLAGGTMNMLPKALYGDLTWAEALRLILTEGEPRAVGGGQVEGKTFYVAAILGSPALWARAREAARGKRLRLALGRARRAFRRAFSGRLRYVLQGQPMAKAEALSFLCPLVSRGVDDENALEVAAINPVNPAEALRIGVRALAADVLGHLIGGWREDPAVTVGRCLNARVWGRARIPAILDGEPTWLSREAPVRFLPTAFIAYVPLGEDREPAS